jgi:hypothetical protein
VAFNISKEKTTEDLMKVLDRLYEKPPASNNVFLMKRLFNMNILEGGSVEDHLNEFNIVTNQLSYVKVKFDDDFMMTHAPSTTRRSEGPCQHRIFPFPLARRASKWLFYFPFGKSSPTLNLKNSPFFLREIGLRPFANPLVTRLSSDIPNLKPVNADPSSSLSDFSLS